MQGVWSREWESTESTKETAEEPHRLASQAGDLGGDPSREIGEFLGDGRQAFHLCGGRQSDPQVPTELWCRRECISFNNICLDGYCCSPYLVE